MRTLIHEVVADIDDAASEIVLIVHWVGRVHSEIRLPKRRRGRRNSTSATIIEAVRQLVLIASDDLIARLLNRNGLKTGNGNRWTRERVTSMRSNYRIPVFKTAEDGNLALAKPQQCRKTPQDRAQDAAASRRSRRDRKPSSALGRPVDHRPHTDNNCRSIYRRTSATEPKIPHGIASQSAKSLLFNNIERWCILHFFLGVSARDRNQWALRHSARKRPSKASMNALSVGLPGRDNTRRRIRSGSDPADGYRRHHGCLARGAPELLWPLSAAWADRHTILQAYHSAPLGRDRLDRRGARSRGAHGGPRRRRQFKPIRSRGSTAFPRALSLAARSYSLANTQLGTSSGAVRRRTTSLARRSKALHAD